VLTGVSGGADSVCLALILRELGYAFAVAHLNHGLRGTASDEDETFTATLSQALGVPFFSRRIVLVSGNIQAAGRDAVREFFGELASWHGFGTIALAHTRNDRIETFLGNLLRGSGPDGLVSMSAVTGNIVRPLIETDRDEVEAYLKQRGQSWRDD